MASQRVWFERKFSLGVPPESRPELVERLRGTPLRLEERVSGLSANRLVARHEGGWSIQEQVGHLADLETLWIGRVDDFAEGRSELRAADLENRATWDANHNERDLEVILTQFRQRRRRLVELVESADESLVQATALHPRLRQPMTLVDLTFFVAEHDDHHLARITALRGS